MNDFYKKTLPFLLIAFLLSVAIRLPTLNRPLAHHHEFCTVVVMTSLENWWDGGMTTYHCAPVMSWQNPTDKFINNGACSTDKMIDKNGNYYYISHPPFAYYLPYFVFKIIHQRPTLLGLEIINLLLNFITALFVYLIVGLLCIKKGRSKIFYPSFIAFCVYLFNPATLWFQSNVYMSDMLVHVFFVIMVYITLKMLMREKFNVPKYIIWYGIVLAMMCYTSWLGYVFVAVVIVYSFWKLQFVSGFKTLISVTVVVSVGILALTIYQYSQINGLENYLLEMKSRYAVRGIVPRGVSGLFANIWGVLVNIKNLLVNYVIHYNLIYLWLIGIFFFVMSKKKTNFVFTRNGYRFLILSGFTILFFHIIFLEYSHHDFSVLYGSLMLSVIVGILFHKILFTRRVKPRWINVSIIVMCSLMVIEFWVMNRAFDATQKKQSSSYNNYNRLSNQKENVLFYLANKEDKMDLLSIYPYKRNVKNVSSIGEAQTFLRAHHQAKGYIINYELTNISPEIIP
ncbi:MAG: hypothetical protein WCP57_07070 [Bacteroidota bacterium]